MKRLWVAVCEIEVEPGDLPSGSTVAFSNVVTRGESPAEISTKISAYLRAFNWRLMSCESVRPIGGGRSYGDELNDLVERAELHPDPILLGRMYSYRPNE